MKSKSTSEERGGFRCQGVLSPGRWREGGGQLPGHHGLSVYRVYRFPWTVHQSLMICGFDMPTILSWFKWLPTSAINASPKKVTASFALGTNSYAIWIVVYLDYPRQLNLGSLTAIVLALALGAKVWKFWVAGGCHCRLPGWLLMDPTGSDNSPQPAVGFATKHQLGIRPLLRIDHH